MFSVGLFSLNAYIENCNCGQIFFPYFQENDRLHFFGKVPTLLFSFWKTEEFVNVKCYQHQGMLTSYLPWLDNFIYLLNAFVWPSKYYRSN